MAINPTGANGGNWELLRQRIDARANGGNGDGRASIRELNAYNEKLKQQNQVNSTGKGKVDQFAVQALVDNYSKMNTQPLEPRDERNGPAEDGLTASEVFQHQAELNKSLIQAYNKDFIENAFR